MSQTPKHLNPVAQRFFFDNTKLYCTGLTVAVTVAVKSYFTTTDTPTPVQTLRKNELCLRKMPQT